GALKDASASPRWLDRPFVQAASHCEESKKMKIDAPLKPPEFKRNELGQFDRPGKTMSNTKKPNKITTENTKIGEGKPGAGRPPGSLNKTTLQLKEAILRALDRLGGDEYLMRLGIENSSAFASLLGKVLPATLAAESDGGGVGGVGITFTRIIV